MKLPEPPIAALQHSRLVTKDGVFGALYTPEQVIAYGRQCAEKIREEGAKLCDEYANDKWALYKGWTPYTGREEGRANHHVQGESDGASNCADDIRKLEVE